MKDFNQKMPSQKEKLLLIGSLSAGVIHDLNNLLAGAYAYLNILETQILETEQRGYLDQIKNTLSQAGMLTRNVLAFLKNEEETEVSVIPHQCLQDMINIAKHTFKPKTSLLLCLPEEFHPLLLSYSDLGQIFLNLLVNAKDAISESGGVIAVQGIYEKDFFQLQIKDTGRGINKQILHRIYEPFFSTKKGLEGTGLGLSIVSELVRKAKGRIEICSIEGYQTTCNVELPYIK